MKEKGTEKKGLPIAKCKAENSPFIFIYKFPWAYLASILI